MVGEKYWKGVIWSEEIVSKKYSEWNE